MAALFSFNSKAINVEDQDGNCPLALLCPKKHQLKHRTEELMTLLLSTKEGSKRVKHDSFRSVRDRKVKSFRSQSFLALAIRAHLSVNVLRLLILLDPDSVLRHAPLENIPIYDVLSSGNHDEMTYFEIMLSNPNCILSKEYSSERRLLEYAIACSAPDNVIKAIIKFYTRERRTIKAKYLRIVLTKQHVSVSVVESLLKANKDIARDSKSGEYELPLFTAIKRKLNASIIDLLIRAYPEAANIQVEGKLPLTIAAKMPKHANQLETCILLWKVTEDLELDLYHQNRTSICLSSANDQLHNWAKSLGAKYGKYSVHTPVRPLYISQTAEVYSCNALVVENESLDKEEDSTDRESEEEDMTEDEIRDTRLRTIVKRLERMQIYNNSR